MSKSKISTMDGSGSSFSMKINPKDPQNSKLQIRKQATIADLPEICLDRILSSFHIKNLIDVAKTNLALRHSAIRVFRLKYGKKKFEIKYANETDMARMIIHFGPHISNITMPFPLFIEIYHSLDKLLKIILEECSPTLTELTISDTYGIPLCTPFPNLQTIAYKFQFGSDIHPTWFQINQWFPKLRKITVFDDDDKKSNFSECLINHMSNLEELCLLLSDPSTRISYPLAQLINTNCHIKSLRITMGSGSAYDNGKIEKFQQKIVWDNLNVSKLDIRQEGIVPVINLKNVAKLKNLKSLAISADFYPNIDRFCFPLNELLVETGGQNSTTVKFIVNHRFLKKLLIKVDGGIGLIHSKRIAEHLKDLTDISFDIVNFEHPNAPDFSNGLIEFVRQCKALKAITVTYQPSEEIPKGNDKTKQIRKMYTDLEGKINIMYPLGRWKLYYECKALDFEFYPHNPVRFLAALQASKHAYIFKFVNEF